MSKSGSGGGKSWVRVVPAGFELIYFTIFLAFKKGEGVSAVLLAIFLRKKGSDSPFFIILFTVSYCCHATMRAFAAHAAPMERLESPIRAPVAPYVGIFLAPKSSKALL